MYTAAGKHRTRRPYPFTVQCRVVLGWMAPGVPAGALSTRQSPLQAMSAGDHMRALTHADASGHDAADAGADALLLLRCGIVLLEAHRLHACMRTHVYRTCHHGVRA